MSIDGSNFVCVLNTQKPAMALAGFCLCDIEQFTRNHYMKDELYCQPYLKGLFFLNFFPIFHKSIMAKPFLAINTKEVSAMRIKVI